MSEAQGPVTESTRPIRVFIAAPIRLYREALAAMLAGEEHLNVVGTAGEATEVVVGVLATAPDAVVMDPSAPRSTELIRTLTRIANDVRIVALGFPEDGPELISYAEAGASGFVTQDESLAALTATIRSVARGELLVSPKAAATLLHRVAALAAPEPERPPTVDLTPRDIDVLRLLEDGLSNKQIARELCIEPPTVKQHVHHILGKLNVKRRGEAVALTRRAKRD